MNPLIFTLKQHTPLIHFQSEQQGATLRASEVKPRLDRFIFEKLGRGSYDKGVKIASGKNWLIKKAEHHSLDYKMSVSENKDEKKEIWNNHINSPMYFGNMGKETPKKHFKFIEFTNIRVRVFSFNDSLLHEIKNHLCEFFFYNNFGARSGKGYGSFEVIKIDDIDCNRSIFSHKFSFKIETDDWQEALFQVSLFYKSLRSGINMVKKPVETDYEEPSVKWASMRYISTSEFYFKPLIFLYAKSEGEQWDKKTIKQVYFNNDYSSRYPSKNESEDFGDGKIETLALKQQLIKHPDSDVLHRKLRESFFDFKDVFGLSTEEKWSSYSTTIKKIHAKENSKPNYFSEEKGSEVIERFGSSIIFKPLKTDENEFTMYVDYKEIPDKYRGQKFIICKSGDEKNAKLCLKIPPDFSFSKFFEFVFNKEKFNIDIHVHEDHKAYKDRNNVYYFEVLNKIYRQLQNTVQS